MTDVKDVYVLLTANTEQFKARMGEAGAKAAETEGLVKNIGKAGLMAGAALAGGAPVGAVALVDMASKFETLTTQIVTGAGESASNLDLIRQGLVNMAGEVGDTPDNLAKSLYNIESAGFHGAAGLNVLRAAEEGTKVGGADAATVADAVTSALNAYGMSGTQAASVTNDFIATVASGKMHMQDLAGALGTILPEAAALHVPLTEISGAMATMTMQGTDANTAATYLRFTLSSLANPTSKAADTMKSLGISSQEVGDTLTNKGLQAALDMVTEAAGRKFPVGSAAYTAAVADMVGGTRGLNAALELTGSHTGQFAANVDAISTSVKNGGSAISGWDLAQQDFSTKLDKAKGAAEGLAISWGTKLLPIFGQGADFFTSTVVPALQGFGSWVETTGIPDVEKFAGWFKDNLLPPTEKIVDAFLQLGGNAYNLAQSLAPVAEAMGGAMLTGFKWIGDHSQILITLVEVWAARWAAMKVLGLGSEILQWAGALRTFAMQEGGVKAVMAALGMGGNSGLSGALRGVTRDFQAFKGAAGEAAAVGSSVGALGAEAETAAPGFLALANPISLAVIAIGGLVAMNWDGIQKGLGKVHDALFGPDWKAQDGQLKSIVGDFQQFSTQVDQAGSSADHFQSDLNGVVSEMQRLSSSPMGNDGDFKRQMQNLQNLQGAYGEMDSLSKADLADLSQANQSAANAFSTAWASNGHDTIAALQSVEAQYPQLSGALDVMVSHSKQKWAEMALAIQQSAVTTGYATNGIYSNYSNLIPEAYATADAVKAINQAIEDYYNGAVTASHIVITSGSGSLGFRQQATGGPFEAGSFSVVGEHGPEVVQWGSSGTVVPHVNSPTLSGGSDGGGRSVSISVGQIVVQGSTNVRETAIAVRDELLNLARGSGIDSLAGSYA